MKTRSFESFLMLLVALAVIPPVAHARMADLGLSNANGAVQAVAVQPASAVQSGKMKTIPVEQLSNRVEKLIKQVEGSTLPCETRNSTVRRLRVLDDALRSGRLSAARSFAQAWRQHSWSQQAGRVISPEMGSLLQRELGGMEGQIGYGWPVKPGPTKHWKPLPSCETGSGGVGGYTPTITDPTADVKIFMKMGLALTPRIGGFLGGFVDLLWPKSGTDMTNLFQQLVDQAIYDLVKADLDGLEALLTGSPGSWNTLVANWQSDCETNGWDSQTCINEASTTLWTNFQIVNSFFIDHRPHFQLNGSPDHRVDLLPLYALYENLYLAFLRDGMQLHDYWAQAGVDAYKLAEASMNEELNPSFADRGIGYVNSIYQVGLAQQPDPSEAIIGNVGWGTRNIYVRNNTLNVLDFRDTWKYMDPHAYPDGVPGGVKLTRMIYSDPVGVPAVTPNLPSNVAGPLKEISVWTEGSGTSPGYQGIGSVQATSPPLLGPAQSGPITGDTSQPENSANYYNLSALGPIIQAKVVGSPYIGFLGFPPCAIGFVFARDGSESWQGDRSCGDFPNYVFSYDGEVLATVQVISEYDGRADSVVFGFRYADSFDPAGEVIGVGSGKCLDLPPSWTNGAQAVIHTCSQPPTPAQIWTYDPNLQQISVRNPAEWSDTDPTNSGEHCLDTAGGSTAIHTHVVISACDDGAVTYDTSGNPVVSSQRWTLEAIGAGIAKITNVKSGLVIDVPNNWITDGTGLQLYRYVAGATGQQWRAHDPLTGEVYGIGAGRCLDVPHQSTTPGTQVQIYDCNGTAAQQWTYDATNKALIYAKAPSLCLDVPGGAVTTAGTPLQIYDCNGTAAQKWRLNGDGSTISNDTSGLVLDVRSGDTGNGTLVQLWNANGTQAQQWSRTSTQGGVVYAVGAGKCLDLNGTEAVIQTCASPLSSSQTWTYHPIAQTVTVGSPSGPKCLDAAGTSVVIDDCTGAASQRWARDYGNSTITNINSGLVLDVMGAGTVDGVPVWLSSPGTPAPDNEKWVWSLN